ncbi:hypothetical protein CWE15_06840 [Aliidiomarina taiwanensis]|uniref:Uncharacterized protein n=1 Tax=Aliidiomarina taiwanensis TaxID=946228 RepID=A0A432X1P9_9GAMM|nr:hypothetical protein [Aliidiomarina taiwanensis]RUO40469.1 hypothetical protein CWE15_06840 [Aliidiomarina taiwanensis]
MKKTRRFVTACVLSPFVFLAACSQEAPQPKQETPNLSVIDTPVFAPVQPAAEGLEDMLAEIRATAGIARAQNPASCKLAEVGVKPCGGPERYIVYSTETADESKLLELIEHYNAASQAYNEKHQLVSDCSIQPRPRVILNQGLCVPQATQTH